ncbi:MAG: hypothetical protein EON95_19950, partial [Caulobacteraceae bacterium]
MSLEDRLYALVDHARQQNGDGFLRAPAQLVPRLSSQAPDLHAEVRMLASILEQDMVARIAGSADQAAEEGRLATEVATRERISVSAFAPALAVARRLGPLGPGQAAPAGGGWAGDSVAVGGAPPPQPQYAPPVYPPPQPGYAPPPPVAAAKPP